VEEEALSELTRTSIYRREPLAKIGLEIVLSKSFESEAAAVPVL
jgi:hypothetical protein